MLLGWTVSPMHIVYVAALYCGIQLVETYLITPIFHKKSGRLPQALTVAVVTLLGLLLGPLGLVLALPILTTVLLLVRRLWIEGRLRADPGPFYGEEG